MSRSTIHIESPRKQRYFLRIAVFFLTLVAILFVILAIFSFRMANKITRIDPKPLENFSSNVMPDYQNVSFRSLDESITLRGWFFPAKSKVNGTVIIVHSYGQNRLPFDSGHAKLYERIISEGYQIMAFDLRSSGESSGNLQTFGYNEWEDVVAAMQHSVRLSGVKQFVLYGIGTGVTASIRAYERIPTAETDLEQLAKGSLVQQQLAELSFDQSAIKGFVFDSALANGDDYISFDVNQSGHKLAPLLSETVPFAVRMSSGLADNLFIVGALSRINFNILLIHQASIDGIPDAVISPVINERQRLFPNRTHVFESRSEVFLGAYDLDDTAYRSAFIDYLKLIR